MKRNSGITKIIGCLSSVFIVWVIIGLIIVPHKMNNTTNYCFSDKSEVLIFEQKLKEENISFSQISDTTVNIINDNREKADNIYNQIFE